MQSLLSSSSYSDLTLNCQGQSFKVYWAIVCPRSPVISAACNGAFQEAFTGEIEVTIADVATLQRVVAYIYTGDYEDGSRAVAPQKAPSIAAESQESTKPSKNPPQEDSPANRNDILINNVHVYIAGDYYDIPELMNLAILKFRNALEPLEVNGFSSVVDVVFNYTPDPATELRNLFKSNVCRNLPTLLHDRQFVESTSSMPKYTEAIVTHLVSHYGNRLKTEVLPLQKRANQAVANVKEIDSQHRQTIANLQKQLEEEKQARVRAENQSAAQLRRTNEMWGAVDVAYNGECRHCGDQSGVYFKADRENAISLRCDCGTRYRTIE